MQDILISLYKSPNLDLKHYFVLKFKFAFEYLYGKKMYFDFQLKSKMKIEKTVNFDFCPNIEY